MKNHYILLLFFALTLMVSHQSFAQSAPQNSPSLSIEELTKLNQIKKVEIFNVLGKRIFTETLFGKELNIAKLNAGVYILKITENNMSATRKLVIK
jgi:hypothetical protein